MGDESRSPIQNCEGSKAKPRSRKQIGRAWKKLGITGEKHEVYSKQRKKVTKELGENTGEHVLTWHFKAIIVHR